MKKKFVTLGIMMALSMTVAAGCGQKAGNETTAQETAESTAADTAAADTTAADTAAPDTTGADGAGSETAAAAQSDGSYQYVSPKEAVAAAKTAAPPVLPDHFHVEVTYVHHYDAYGCSHYPGASLISPTTVAFDADDYGDVLRFFYFVI